jgi:hypothetical protein
MERGYQPIPIWPVRPPALRPLVASLLESLKHDAIEPKSSDPYICTRLLKSLNKRQYAEG